MLNHRPVHLSFSSSYEGTEQTVAISFNGSAPVRTTKRDIGTAFNRSHFVTKLTPTRRHEARCQASSMGWNLNAHIPFPLCTFTSTGLSHSLLSGRDLFLVLVDKVCTCLGNGLFSVFFFALGTTSFILLAGLTSLLVVSLRSTPKLLGCAIDCIWWSISLLRCLHISLVGNRHTGARPNCCSSLHLSASAIWMTLCWGVKIVSSVGQPRRTQSSFVANSASRAR